MNPTVGRLLGVHCTHGVTARVRAVMILPPVRVLSRRYETPYTAYMPFTTDIRAADKDVRAVFDCMLQHSFVVTVRTTD